ncbi:hypothetical protein A9X06_04905 [Mycobacterium sp. 852002-51759_SCH5129042]|nr:hypothetical protein A9X06_04905 [Mycobacterium sp. 852002-51759_SCH5129042]
MGIEDGAGDTPGPENDELDRFDRELARILDLCSSSADHELSEPEARIIAQAYGFEPELVRFGDGGAPADTALALREVERLLDYASIVREPTENFAYPPGANGAFLRLRDFFRKHSDAEILAEIQRVFLDGVRDETFPATVTSFGDLHDHVDANLIADELVTRRTQLTTQPWHELITPIQDMFTTWLSTADARDALAAIQNTTGPPPIGPDDNRTEHLP